MRGGKGGRGERRGGKRYYTSLRLGPICRLPGSLARSHTLHLPLTFPLMRSLSLSLMPSSFAICSHPSSSLAGASRSPLFIKAFAPCLSHAPHYFIFQRERIHTYFSPPFPLSPHLLGLALLLRLPRAPPFLISSPYFSPTHRLILQIGFWFVCLSS